MAVALLEVDRHGAAVTTSPVLESVHRVRQQVHDDLVNLVPVCENEDVLLLLHLDLEVETSEFACASEREQNIIPDRRRETAPRLLTRGRKGSRICSTCS